MTAIANGLTAETMHTSANGVAGPEHRFAERAGPKLRLGIFSPNYPGITGEGGIGTYVKRLAKTLAENGNTIRVLVPGDRPRERDRDVNIDFVSTRHAPVIDRFWAGAGACYRVGNAMSRLVRDHALDVVEFPNWEGLAPWFAWRRRVPLVVRLHTSSLETIRIDGLEMNRVRRADVRRERMTARLADVLVTHSRAHQQAMAEELEIDAGRIQIVPHGIEPAGNSQVRREPATVVCLGRMERRKGTLDLLNAVPLVLKEVPSARFVLIGSDRPHCPGGRTHAQYLSDEFPPVVQQHVTLAGMLPQEQVEDWLQRATLFTAPSLYESFGLIFLEAMRWGTPVIGTTAGGIPEIIEHDRSGLLVPPQQPAALAAAIIALLNNPTRCRTLGDAGRQRCERDFSMHQMAQNSLALYSDAISRWRK